DLVKRVNRRAAARLAVANLEPAVGQYPVARGGLFMDVAALRVALAPGDKDGAGVDDLRPPAEIGIALVEHVTGAPFQRNPAAGRWVWAAASGERHGVRRLRW